MAGPCLPTIVLEAFGARYGNDMSYQVHMETGAMPSADPMSCFSKYLFWSLYNMLIKDLVVNLASAMWKLFRMAILFPLLNLFFQGNQHHTCPQFEFEFIQIFNYINSCEYLDIFSLLLQHNCIHCAIAIVLAVLLSSH